MIHSSQDESLDLTTHRCVGLLKIKDIADVIQNFYQTNPTKNVLWDFSRADLSSIRSSEIEALVRMVLSTVHSRQGGKNAIVASHDVAFGLGRVYQSVAETKDQMTETRVFRGEQEALKWISQQEGEGDGAKEKKA